MFPVGDGSPQDLHPFAQIGANMYTDNLFVPEDMKSQIIIKN